jgi:hypothetical protein
VRAARPRDKLNDRLGSRPAPTPAGRMSPSAECGHAAALAQGGDVRTRRFGSATGAYSECLDEQVGHDRENPNLCDEPTDWPYTRRREGVCGNI